MANTMTLISSITLNSAQSSLSFTSIPQTYTDLCLMVSLRTAQSGGQSDARITLNGTNTGINSRGIDNRTSIGTSFNYSNAWYGVSAANASGSTSNTFTNWQVYIPNYTSTTQYKSGSFDYIRESNDAASNLVYTGFSAGIYTANTAITSIGVENDGNWNYLQYTTAYLYGIKNS
jgi:hypothetical protein